MRSEVARDLRWSARAFVNLVWPLICDACGGGELIPVEGNTTDDMARRFDMLAGIDAWQVHGINGLRGIASRVQVGAAWDTFTIRYARSTGAETEYVKRLRAMNNREQGWLWPHLTAQAYIDDSHEHILSCAVVRTEDLFREAQRAEQAGFVDVSMVNDRTTTIYLNEARDDGNQFVVVPWRALEQSGIRIKAWHPKPERTAVLA